MGWVFIGFAGSGAWGRRAARGVDGGFRWGRAWAWGVVGRLGGVRWDRACTWGTVARLGAGSGRIDLHKVCAVETLLVLVMDDNGAVSEERAKSLQGRGVQVSVDSLVDVTAIDAGDLSVLAAEVSNLASLGCGGVTRRVLAADEGVKMGKCFSAVAALWNWIDVDVIG